MSPSRARFPCVLWSSVLSFLTSSAGFAATIVVAPAGGGAFTAIQPALDAALDGDTVLVKPGEYVISEPIDFNRLHDPGDPGSPPVKDLVLRSEGGAVVTTIRMAAEPANPGRASVVVFESAETSASVLEGFTVTGGNGSSISPSGTEPFYGGGILIRNGSAPIIRGCVIDDNEAGEVFLVGDYPDYYELGGSGGGIAALDATVTLIDSTVSNNGAQYSGSLYDSGCGGGIYAEGGSVTIVDCGISRNGTLGAPSLIDEWGDGGGVYCIEGTVNIHRTTVRDNDGGDCGGGLLLVRCQSTVFGCEIEGNYVDTYGGSGGGVHVREGSLTLVHSRVAENYGSDGGIYVYGAATAWLGQSEVSGNECSYGVSEVVVGGATLACEDSRISGQDVGKLAVHAWGGSRVRLERCTLAGNRDAALSGDPTSSFDLESCIVWGGGGQLVGADNEPQVTAAYCDIQGGSVFPGTGNILADPLFVSVGSSTGGQYVPGDYHLQLGSPCVDTGGPRPPPARDVDGYSRPCGAGVDIGAYERGGCRDELILDDGDPGTYAVGRWPPSGGTLPWDEGCVYGYEDGSTYTFDLVVPGTAEWAVDLWWTTWPSRLTAVPVEIEHAGGTARVLVNQQANGGKWNRLGTFTFEGQAVVRILAATGGSTCADGVRLVPVEAPPPPSTELTLDNGGPGTSSVGWWATSGAPSPYGASSVYSSAAGTSYRYEVAVPSAGSYEVSLWWTQWSSRLTAVPVEIQHAGGTATVYVNQRTNGGKWNVLGTWTFSGTAVITIRSLGGGSTCADAVKLVGGGAPPPPPPPPSTELILDNGGPGTSSVGWWATSGAPSPYGASSVYSSAAGTSYRYEVAVPSAGSYEVSLWWTQWSSRLGAVPVEIQHAGGTATVYVNQRTNGGKWNVLGTWTFSGTAVITIRSLGGGSTCADAVKLVAGEAPPPPPPPPPSSTELILDNGQAGTSSAGSWAVSGAPNPYGANSVYSGASGTSYRYQVAVPAAGSYAVSLWWTQWSSRLGAVPVEIQHAGGTATVYVNQRTNGGKWNVLGTWTFSGTAVITIRSLGGGSTCADAVKLVAGEAPPPPPPPATELILDNGQPGTTSVGSWPVSGGPSPYGANSVYSGASGTSYRYELAIPSAGTWEVSLWWTQWSSRLAAVPVEIQHAGGTATVYVDQRTNGGKWNALGTWTFSGPAVITIRSLGGGSTCADAVRLVLQ